MLRELNFTFILFRHRYLGRAANYSPILINIRKLTSRKFRFRVTASEIKSSGVMGRVKRKLVSTISYTVAACTLGV
jgi:hypothetical protein